MALAFDLAIRAATRNRKSLDDVMRLLWTRFGRAFYQGKPKGVGEDEVAALIVEATGVDLGRLFDDAVSGTRDLPLADLFAPFGVNLAPDAGPHPKPSIGARARAGGADCTLAVVHEGGAAHRAGLSVGDVLIAIDGLRVTGSNLDALLARFQPGDRVEAHAFRRDELRATTLRLDAPDVVRYRLLAADKPAAQLAWQKSWLGL